MTMHKLITDSMQDFQLIKFLCFPKTFGTRPEQLFSPLQKSHTGRMLSKFYHDIE